ncbi:MAG: hypothetical protein F4Y39_08860 [Gemmatimonadetes bacterium]|nr:hypothetical protein [Gemmatimonadota bacterium]MYK54748.1 hypothetical protein [Gemmatimonadota bacterium]
METNKRKKGKGRSVVGSATAVTPNAATAPTITPRAVTDPGVIDQGRVFSEAVHQTQPLASAGSREAAQAAQAVGDGTALQNGLRPETCERLVTNGKELGSLVSGANPNGKAAEVVAVSDYRDLHTGGDPNITNAPHKIADNVQDIRLSPDHASRKDLVFQFRTKDGMLITKPNGQVKTGSGQYVSRKLVQMAESPGYGKVGYVDSRYVNPDGTPRVAPDGFTDAQARSLQKAKVRLRGIKDLDSRAEKLVEDIVKHADDGLDPVARQHLQQLRDDIAMAYQPRNVATRVAGGAAAAAATAAILTLIFQVASGGEIDVAEVGKAAGKGALFGAGGAIADAGIYHGGASFGMTPEAAKAVSQNGVAVGFCLLAVGADVFSEIKSARQGDISVANAVAGSAFKSALDVLPLVLAPLGIAGVPILVGTQIGGRWVIDRVREADRKLEVAIEEDLLRVARLHMIVEKRKQEFESVVRACDETDALYEQVMSQTTRPSLRVIKS